MLIDWEVISESCNITGVIHVGAHTGEEYKYYKGLPVIWIEGDPVLARNLKVTLENDKTQTVLNHVIGNGDRRTWFKTYNTAAQSILEPHLNKEWREDAKVKAYKDVTTITLNDALKDINKKGLNFINLDIQGAELLALKGFDLTYIDYIYCEVHEVETYKNIPKVIDIDLYLKDQGFKRTLTQWTARSWGDALYIRNE